MANHFLKKTIQLALLLGVVALQHATASPVVKFDRSADAARKDYYELIKTISKRHCEPGDENRYWKLLRDFRRESYYLPAKVDGHLDHSAIKQNLNLLKKRINWLKTTVAKLPKAKRFDRRLAARFDIVQKRIDRLLLIKETHYLKGNSKAKSREILKKGNEELELLRTEFRHALNGVAFLRGPFYPVDHFENRRVFEGMKNTQDAAEKLQANQVMFQRKIYEDGTFNSRQSYPDKILRTTIDTVGVRLQKQRDLIDEQLRIDLEYVIAEIKKILSRPVSVQKGRLNDWLNRSRDHLSFYEAVLKDKQEKALVRKAKARQALKNFVIGKEADVYKTLTEYPEGVRAIYAIENILFNEVGEATMFNFRDRRDVTQVVINRITHPTFSKLFDYHALQPKLVKAGVPYQNYPWLNVMFQEGEFSFTYYFIPGSLKIFCPDRSRAGHTTRYKNVELAIKLLQKPIQFEALRYFSRQAMTGRIDMSQAWPGFERIAERPGAKLNQVNALKKAINKRKYRFLYGFKDPRGRDYVALEIYQRPYVVQNYRGKTPTFFWYRHPDEFSYFREVSTQSLAKP